MPRSARSLFAAAALLCVPVAALTVPLVLTGCAPEPEPEPAPVVPVDPAVDVDPEDV